MLLFPNISDLDAGDREMFGYVVDPKGYAAVSKHFGFGCR